MPDRPAPLPAGVTRCRHTDRQQGDCPGHVHWDPPSPDGRITGTCNTCGRCWVDWPRDHLGQAVRA